ncbi:hypothetical protein [Polyangium aurulentum]|uniref:hypothetical protein n=1 Tax=Polyangium aurulentum TaxID=2567896 RepID=UPI0010AEA7F6|nr:hypothetical protein [Polyangium aurulentum]UQA62930.1 hypothetical protein E8A73_021725 [Polyangium aurulentum]
MMRSITFTSSKTSTFTALALVGLGLAGCASPMEMGREDRSAAAATEDVFFFAGSAGTSAHVTRKIAADGAETLHGETEIAIGESRRVIVEDVTIDANGHLERAEVAVVGGEGGETRVHMRLDPSRGIAEVRSIDGASTWRMPSEEPWVYAPWSQGGSTATPVSAWVAMRAAVASPWARVVMPEARAGVLSPRDQIAVPTEAGTTVVLGRDGADVDGTFVARLHVGGSDACARVKGNDLVL